MNWLIGACEAFDKHQLGFLNDFFTTLLKICHFWGFEALFHQGRPRISGR